LIIGTYNIQRQSENFKSIITHLKRFDCDFILCIQEDLDSPDDEERKDNGLRKECKLIAESYGVYLCNTAKSIDTCTASVYATARIARRMEEIESSSNRHAIFNLNITDDHSLIIIGLHAPSQLYPQSNKLYLQQTLRIEIDKLFNQTNSMILLGDFNDNPFSESMSTVYGLNAKPCIDESIYLCNPTWLYGSLAISETHSYGLKTNVTRHNIFDQIIVSKDLAKAISSIKVLKEKSIFEGLAIEPRLQSDHNPVFCKLNKIWRTK
jgi:exonuclease III